MFASLTSVVAVALLGLAGVSANPAPCDCYVDTHGDYAYINMWKGYPCSGKILAHSEKFAVAIFNIRKAI
jgi:hypothetical protein